MTIDHSVSLLGKKPSPCGDNCKGFTLVEFSIVMVIIGLVLGGVTAGRDLIKAAELRAAVTQVEEYQVAVYTFRNKYNALPGDIDSLDAAQIGLSPRSGGVGKGDDNGVIEACSSGATGAGCETLLFWADLSATVISTSILANVSGTYSNSILEFGGYFKNIFEYLSPVSSAYAAVPGGGMVISGAAAGTAINKKDVFPESALGNFNYMIVYASEGLNYFQIAGITSTDASGDYDLSNQITPMEAVHMDTKIDDADPYTGKVMAMEGDAPNTEAVADPSGCVVLSGSKYYYNTATSVLANSTLCQLRIAMK